MHCKTTYLIVGQGLCGTLLSYFFYKNNIPFLLIDKPTENTASKIASGVINPVTGRRVVTTWMIEKILPFAFETYNEIQSILNIQIIKEMPIIQLHNDAFMQNNFEKKVHNNPFIFNEDIQKFNTYFNTAHQVHKIFPSYLIDVRLLLENWKNFLIKINCYNEMYCDWNNMNLSNENILINNIECKKIIFCTGIDLIQIPLLKQLPYSFSKGEAIIIKAPLLPRNVMYKNKMSIIPWQENQFWVGSNYIWNYMDDKPEMAFKENATHFLTHFLKIPFEIIAHLAGIRPTNLNRRPFVGWHPTQSNLGIFNGMGTKGCSLAPYFANQFTNQILKNSPLQKEVDIEIFLK